MRKLLELQDMKKDLKEVERFLSEYTKFEHGNLRKYSQHTLDAGGKRIRPAFVLMTAKFIDKNRVKEVIPLAAAVELIHMATLIHDDVIDESDLRRGRPTVRVLHGNRYSLHTGDYLLAKALQLVDTERKAEIAQALAEVSVEMCQGEVQQLLSMYDPEQNVEDYYYRIKRKTALLIEVSCKIGALAVDAEESVREAFTRFGYNLGMAFQIKDDLLDMEVSSAKLGKPAGSDLAHGIITLPTILVMQKDFPEKNRLKQLIIDKFPQGQKEVEEAIAIIKQYGGIEEAMEYATMFVEKAKEELVSLPNCPAKRALIDGANYINERNF